MSDNEGMSQFECRTCLRIITKEAGFHELFQPWHSPWNPSKKSIIAQDLTKLTNIVVWFNLGKTSSFIKIGSVFFEIKSDNIKKCLNKNIEPTSMKSEHLKAPPSEDFIELHESDKQSKVICQGCCVKLYNACQFIVTTKKSDQILKQRNVKDVTEIPVSFEGKLWPKPIQVDKNVNSDIYGDVEIKQEVLSEDVEDNIDDNDIETDFRPNMDIKIEPEEIEAPPLRITVNGTIPVEQMGKHRSIVSNGCESFEKVEYLDSTIKEEPLSDDESHQDLPLECMLCSKHFNSVSGLKAHVIAHHSYKSVRRKTTSSSPVQNTSSDKFVCGTCRRAFVTRTDLMVHETCHNKWVCYGCSRNFDSFGRLSKHRKYCKAALQKEASKPKLLEDVIRPLPEISMEKILAHNEEEPMKETLQCNMCSEKFSDSYYMKIHHEIHHAMEAQNDDAQSNAKELSKESKDLETKALQNMFEQVNEAQSQGNVQMEVNVNIEPNGEQNNAGEEIREISNEMEIESEVLPVIFKYGTDVREDNRVAENVAEPALEQNKESEENIEQNQNTESVQFDGQAIDESHTQINEETVISQKEDIDTTQNENDVNNLDDHVKVSVEIVSEGSDKIADENINNEPTEDSLVLEETISRNDQDEQEIAEEIVGGENTLTVTEVDGFSVVNETEENVNNEIETSVNDEEIIQEVAVGETVETGDSSDIKGDSKNNEASDGLPMIDVRGHEEMEIDSEI